SKEMFFWVGADGVFQFVNDAVVHNLGYTKQELIGMTVWEVVKEITEEGWEQHFQSVKLKKNVQLETTQIRKDGGTHPVETNLNFISFNGKEYICAIVRNIAKRKERDAKIYLSDFTLEKAGDLIFWVEPTDGSIVNVNEATCTRLGYSRDELLNMKVYDLEPSLTPELYQFFWQDVKTNQYRVAESTLQCKSGEHFDMEIRSNYINYQGKELHCAFVQDITERKEREQKLQSAMKEIEALRDQLQMENTYLQEEISDQHNFKNIISKSPRYKKVLRQVEEVANTDATVLITGETGTGKELLARAVHELSDRSERSLVKVNCAALPANLIESELFGHEKGAFTGAFAKKIGRFEMANRGTIFLDEIGELPLELQAKLLRVLQEGEFERLGGNQTIKVDVRVIAATNRDLAKQIQKKKFREDLYYRLNVFPIENIPLRDRKEDIPLLVNHFIQKYNGKIGKKVSSISPTNMNRLVKYNYPGNVRELENIIERSIILSRGKALTLATGVFSNRRNKKEENNEIIAFEAMQKQYLI
ncbi:MAG: sigma 54-interacting transcriptional regulator, partial [Bacteroidota bacterium]